MWAYQKWEGHSEPLPYAPIHHNPHCFMEWLEFALLAGMFTLHKSIKLMYWPNPKAGFCTRFVSNRNSAQTHSMIWLSIGGELFSYLRRHVRFPVSTTQFFAAEITSVFGFLHRHGVVYRDLKPENVMIDARGHIRLVDFGFSKVIGDCMYYSDGRRIFLLAYIFEQSRHTLFVVCHIPKLLRELSPNTK